MNCFIYLIFTSQIVIPICKAYPFFTCNGRSLGAFLFPLAESNTDMWSFNSNDISVNLWIKLDVYYGYLHFDFDHECLLMIKCQYVQ